MTVTTVDPIVFSSTASIAAGNAPVVALVFGAVAVDDGGFVPPTTGVYRGSSVLTSLAWRKANAVPVEFKAPWVDSQTARLEHAVPLQPAQAASTGFVAPWTMDFERTDSALQLVWQGAAPIATPGTAVPWRKIVDIPALGATLMWGKQAKTLQNDALLVWSSLEAENVAFQGVYKPAKHTANVVQVPWGGRATDALLRVAIPWQNARALFAFGGGAFDVRGAAAATTLQPVQVPLVFCETYPTNGWGASIPIVYGVSRCNGHSTDGSQYFILPARFYMTVHNITAQLLPQIGNGSGTFIGISNVTVSADTGSFCWSFNASGHISLFDQLTPTNGLPQRIRFDIDGIGFVFVVGQVRETEAFGKKGVQFSGQSVTKLLSEPYARVGTWFNSTAQTAQQLAENVLQYSGITLDWGVTDWLVPAGAWSHQGTPLSAVQSIAQSIGGYVQSHRTDPVLQVRHPYPLLAGGLPGGPWNWYAAGVVPDVSLAAEALMTIGTERRDGADINAVYVSGTNQGVLALVKRIGTAGEKLANLVTDPLITANAAAQQRGLSVLGAAGAKHFTDFELPILTGNGQPGILDVGQLALVNQINLAGEVAPWRGRVRSVNASASFGGKVRQAINVERHLEVTP